jgi:hypothetical protein
VGAGASPLCDEQRGVTIGGFRSFKEFLVLPRWRQRLHLGLCLGASQPNTVTEATRAVSSADTLHSSRMMTMRVGLGLLLCMALVCAVQVPHKKLEPEGLEKEVCCSWCCGCDCSGVTYCSVAALTYTHSLMEAG